jgi:hypothetical protein
MVIMNLLSAGRIKNGSKMVRKGLRNELCLRNKVVSRFNLGDSVVIISKFGNVLYLQNCFGWVLRLLSTDLNERSLSVLMAF